MSKLTTILWYNFQDGCNSDNIDDAEKEITALIDEIIGPDIDVEHWANNKEQRLAMTTANQLRAEQRTRAAALTKRGSET